MSFISDLFGGGGEKVPEPTRVSPTRIEPVVKPRKKRRGSLATQAMLSEPMIKEEKLGT